MWLRRTAIAEAFRLDVDQRPLDEISEDIDSVPGISLHYADGQRLIESILKDPKLVEILTVKKHSNNDNDRSFVLGLK